MTTDQQTLHLGGASTLAFLSRVESASPALPMIDIAEAYSLCAKLEAHEGNTRLAYSILDRFIERLDEAEEVPHEVRKLIARARARVASRAMSTTVKTDHRRHGPKDPMTNQPTRFTLSGLTRRHR